MNAEHPENIFPSGPSSLDPEALQAEIAQSKYAIAFSGGMLALTAMLTATNVMPNFIGSVEQADAGDIAQYSVLAVIMGGVSYLSVANIRAYGRRWKQARYNQRLNDIAEANNMGPESP